MLIIQSDIPNETKQLIYNCFRKVHESDIYICFGKVSLNIIPTRKISFNFTTFTKNEQEAIYYILEYYMFKALLDYPKREDIWFDIQIIKYIDNTNDDIIYHIYDNRNDFFIEELVKPTLKVVYNDNKIIDIRNVKKVNVDKDINPNLTIKFKILFDTLNNNFKIIHICCQDSCDFCYQNKMDNLTENDIFKKYYEYTNFFIV